MLLYIDLKLKSSFCRKASPVVLLVISRCTSMYEAKLDVSVVSFTSIQ
jgi:hypothetical protein